VLFFSLLVFLLEKKCKVIEAAPRCLYIPLSVVVENTPFLLFNSAEQWRKRLQCVNISDSHHFYALINKFLSKLAGREVICLKNSEFLDTNNTHLGHLCIFLVGDSTPPDRAGAHWSWQTKFLVERK
jgi:hypothetical protein